MCAVRLYKVFVFKKNMFGKIHAMGANFPELELKHNILISNKII